MIVIISLFIFYMLYFLSAYIECKNTKKFIVDEEAYIKIIEDRKKGLDKFQDTTDIVEHDDWEMEYYLQR
ncbi:MAG: hypothetical protein ACRDBY_00710 [Cetobacterium sp.]|uniref:hypothetical protein n=1 Tax=Clostridium sp. TaxID=1506 RepID=UPI003EE46E99